MQYVLIYLAISTSIQMGTAYLCGLAVNHRNVRVNYTRKIMHFTQFLLPTILYELLPFGLSPLEETLGVAFYLFGFVIFVRPVRERVPVIKTMFASIDRPEDRPYTLLWVVSQYAVAGLALMPLRYFASVTDAAALVLIPILINGIGDGLAEPVGVRFGRHPYRTSGLFVDRDYVRTLEGSACVFVVSIISVVLMREVFTPLQLVFSLILIPVCMTLTEAKSPHSWDAPFLYFIGGTLLMLIKILL